jgi:PAS domain S-box-containing protein
MRLSAPTRIDRGSRPPLLYRLPVGTKLMLLALLPVCCLVAVAVVAGVAGLREAGRLEGFRDAARVSFATAQVADDLRIERSATVLARVDPGPSDQVRVATARRITTRDLGLAARQAAGKSLPVDVTGNLDRVRRQRQMLLPRTAQGSAGVQEIASAYGEMAMGLLDTVRGLDNARPTRATGRAADAYLAILRAVEAAGRERVQIMAILAPHGRRPAPAPSRWEMLEGAELDAFRGNAAPTLLRPLQAVLSSPSGVQVQRVRDVLSRDPVRAAHRLSLGDWLAPSTTRVTGLDIVAHGAASSLARTISHDLNAARARAVRDIGLSLLVLALVTALAFALRRSIRRPLREVSEGARALSSGELEFDVAYAGYDEIGDVAAAFGDLQVMAARLADEIRAMNAAIRDNRLDHGADLSTFEGTWRQLLGGMNDTMAAFAELQERQQKAERQAERVFDMSVDLLCIAGFDGYFKRVNPAFERMLGHSAETLLSRPIFDFVHPDDRERTRQASDALSRGSRFAQFENRYVRADGSVCWLQWTARPVPDEGALYAAGRDVTEARRAADQQSALRRVATLVARGVAPGEIFEAVASETVGVLDVDASFLARLESDGGLTLLAVDSRVPPRTAVGERLPDDPHGIAGRVVRTGRAARIESYDDVHGSAAEFARTLGLRGSVGAPIIVDGRLWGVLTVSWATPRAMPPGSEERAMQFTELIATAIANAEGRAALEESRAESRHAAEEQAALRRIATLVARGVPAAEIFDAVTGETRRILGVDHVSLMRLEGDGSATLVAANSALPLLTGVGERFMPDDDGTIARVRCTGRPAYVERYEGDSGPTAERLVSRGYHGGAAAPIVVESRLWGVIVAAWAQARAMPPGSEDRLAQFTELVGTAIANTQSRAELVASRARVVETGDEVRRRIERDLHDGVQQRLVVLGLHVRALEERAAETSDDELREQLAQVSQALGSALDDLREISLGIHPAILRHGGLRPAVRALARRCPVPVQVDLPRGLRLPQRVAVAAYYVVSEALTNIAKHAQASVAKISGSEDNGFLELTIRDDGVGGARSRGGTGLIGLTDRVEALGGKIRITSPPGEGTTVHVTLPVEQAPSAPVLDHA